MTDKQPDALSRLILDRMAELDLSYGDVERNAKNKGHKISRASVHAIANQYERHHAPYERTLRALAAGLDYPYDVIAAAAAASAGYVVQEVTTTLQSAGTLRILAAVHEELTPEQQQELAGMAEKYMAELKKAKQKRGTCG